MALGDIFKFSRKTFFNPRAWLDYDWIRNQNLIISVALKNLFTPVQPGRAESFEEALKRFNLSEEDLTSTVQSYVFFAILFLCCGLLLFFYAFYLLFSHHSFSAWLLSFGTAALFFAQAFKYDFWAMQIRARKLGMTFSDWIRHILGGKGPSA